MPIYEYTCQACGQIEEVIQKFSDAPASICSHCGKAALKKNVTAPGFQLAGGGWYANGYQDTASAPAAADSGKTDGKAASKTTTEAAAPVTPPAKKTAD